MNFSFQQIAAFVCVAQTGNFSRAARQLNKDRSTVSQIIRNLEIDLGYELFDRTGKFPVLTEKGQNLLPYAHRLVLESNSFSSIATTQYDDSETEINVGLSGLIPADIISHAMQHFSLAYPHTAVHWHSCTTNSEVKTGLLDKRLDLGLVLVPDGSSHSSIYPIHFMNMPMSAVCSVSANIPASISVKDLVNYRQLVSTDLTQPVLRELYCVGRHIDQMSNTHLLMSMLQSIDCWSMLPQRTVQPLVEQNILRHIMIEESCDSLDIPVSLWSMPHVTETPARQYLIEQLINAAQR